MSLVTLNFGHGENGRNIEMTIQTAKRCIVLFEMVLEWDIGKHNISENCWKPRDPEVSPHWSIWLHSLVFVPPESGNNAAKIELIEPSVVIFYGLVYAERVYFRCHLWSYASFSSFSHSFAHKIRRKLAMFKGKLNGL